MHMRVYCVAAMFIFAISGCMSTRSGSPPIGATRVPCPANQCEEIVVTVVETGTMAEPACKVEKVSIPVASIAGEPAGPKALRWVLNDPDHSPYEFSKVDWKFAIVFKDEGADPNGVFSNATVSGKRLSIMFQHKTTASANGYSYGITVRRSTGGQFCTTLDPWFVG